ncbi:MAG: Ig-like domain-containing protein [Methanosarcinales archaeon]|nr:Ig-like domain-containing protein [Methanosarcinales archaeon]
MNGTLTTVWHDRTGQFKDDAINESNLLLFDSYDIIAVVHPGLSEQVSHDTDDMLLIAFPDSIVGRKNTFVVSENDLMGSWAHEFGHLVGEFETPHKMTPDRYNNGDLKSWDLMASGNYLTDQDGNVGGISFPSHMSSWTKEYMGWLKYNITSKTGTYWVPALEQMQYGDDVLVYDVPKQSGMNKYSYILEVRSENVGVWDRYLYGNKSESSNILVIYQVNTTSIGDRSDVVNIYENKTSKNDMVILKPGDPYTDSLVEIKIDLVESIGNTFNGYGGKIKIVGSSISNQNGGAISTTGNPSNIDFISPTKDMNLTLPDYDLHAFTQDGRHVGVNYTSGDYENQIDGATTSGDLLGGVEWIFVPEYEDAKFMVSNHDTEEFLKKYPGAANITADMKYNLTIYHEDSRSIRYNAGATEQQIAPGKERNYLFNIVENMDGTFTIILDHESPVISGVSPSNNSIVGTEYNISAKYMDEGTGVDINSIKLKVDGTDVTSDAIITESSLIYSPLLEDGGHTFEMMVADNMENAATLNHSFTVDTTPPEVDIIYPANNSFVHKTVEIEGIATDLHLDTVSLEINDIEVSSNPGFTWDTAAYSDGTYTIRLTAIDVVGNSASTSINVIVDNTPPNVSIDLINGTEFYSDEFWTVNFTATDNLSGIDTAALTIDGIERLKDDIVDMRYLSLGEHEVVMSAYDNAGNYNSTSANFTIKPLPAIVEISPKTLNINSNGNWITGFIEVPGYSPELIDVSTVKLNDAIHAEINPTGIGDNNGNGTPDMMVKFNRSEVQNLIQPGNVTVIIAGKVNDAAFLGDSRIIVIDIPAKEKGSENKGREAEKNEI